MLKVLEILNITQKFNEIKDVEFCRWGRVFIIVERVSGFYFWGFGLFCQQCSEFILFLVGQQLRSKKQIEMK
jgi:hypothetical protein